MSNPTPAVPDNTVRRIIVGALCGGLTSYLLTQLSIHGVDFKEFGIDSEIVKGAITATVTAYVMAPILIVYKIRDAILWFSQARRIISDARKGEKTYETFNEKDTP